jgi:hypothetical protein
VECGLLVNDGAFRRLTVEEAEGYRGPGFVWLHLHGWDEGDRGLLKRQDYIPEVAASALIATETRPRCDRIDFGAIVNLRGPGELDPNDSDRLVSIRLWVHENRVTSVSRRRMTATKHVMALMEAGKINDPGDLVAPTPERSAANSTRRWPNWAIRSTRSKAAWRMPRAFSVIAARSQKFAANRSRTAASWHRTGTRS